MIGIIIVSIALLTLKVTVVFVIRLSVPRLLALPRELLIGTMVCHLQHQVLVVGILDNLIIPEKVLADL